MMNIARRLIFGTLIFLSALPVFAQENVRKIAVLGFEALDTTEQTAALARKAVEETLFTIEGVTLIERERIELVLKEQEFQLSDLADQQNAVQIGRFLAADTIAFGSVQQVEEFIVTVKFIDVETGSVLYVDSQSAQNRELIQEVAQRITMKAERLLFPQRFFDPTWNVRMSGGLSFPLGEMHDLLRMGYRGDIGVSVINLFVNHLIGGIQSRFTYYPGLEENTQYFISIPVLLAGGYRIELENKLIITPKLSTGLSIDLLSWDEDGFVAGFEDPIYSLSTAVSPTLSASVALGYPLGRFPVEFAGDVTIIFEHSNLLLSFGINVGTNIAF